jgi:Mg2+-importing ATPase
VLWNQLRSPLLWLLLFAAVVSALSGEWTDAAIVLTIVAASAGIGYHREYRSQSAAAALRARVKTRANVLRSGQPQLVPIDEVVPGDVVLVCAGSLVPADAVVLESADCYLSEAALTGESFPVEKHAGPCPADTPLAKRTNCLYLGTNVRSGTARCIVVTTGARTAFGDIAHRLSLRPPETEFDRGVRHFGYLVTSAMCVMMALVFFAHMLRGAEPVDTLLFSIALAVGLSPELLPAILSVNLGRGAEAMARHGVLVRHLSAIENLGSMDVLCTDKTGTLTVGVVEVEGAYDPTGAPSPAVLSLAAINAAFETGLPSPLDDAILNAKQADLSGLRKCAEIPFDFNRKRVSTIVEQAGRLRLITKGAFHHVVEVCTELDGGDPIDDAARARLLERFEAWSREGIRVLAVATRALSAADGFGRDAEHGLSFAGFVTFSDRPKEGVAEAIAGLSQLGVTFKLITGDTKLVAVHVAKLVGLPAERVLTGADLDALHDEALWREAERTDLFVEVDPNQKERIILSLKKMGHVVGFLGDGVNDAPAMHAADTSLSVEGAVDVAREAADFLLLERHLNVIRRGIQEGRRTFANTLKYLLTTMSANLGNMVSMAIASLFLPFLPLLAGQVLLNNLLSDVPAIGLADDSVDPELVARPRRWQIRFIGRFMIEFGVLSSVFDMFTFGVVLFAFHTPPAMFRTAWFVESLVTELVIALVVRTRRPFYASRPGRLLLVSSLSLVVVAFAIPYLPGAGILGFVPLPPALLGAVAAITLSYVAATELLKRYGSVMSDLDK